MRKGFRTFYHVMLWGVLCASLAACTPEPSVYIFSAEMCSTNGPGDVQSHTRSLEIRVHCHKEGYWEPCESFTEADWSEVESRQAEDSSWHEKNWTYTEAEFAGVRQQCSWAIPGQDMGTEEDMSDEPDMSVTEPDMADEPAPESPPQPRVTATGVKDGVRLEWAPVEGATSYQIKRLDRGTWEDVGAETSWLDEATDPVTVEELVFEAGDATHRDHVELTATYKSTDPVFYSYQVRALNKDVPGPESSRIEAARSHPLYHEFEALDEESTWQTLATEDDPSFLHTEAPGKGDYVDYRMRVVDADGVPFSEYETGTGRRLAVVDIDVGFTFSCAILNDGTVWCWGSASYQPLGPASAVLDPIQMDFGTDADVRSLHLGGLYGCALLGGDNRLWCWGDVPSLLLETPEFSTMPLEGRFNARYATSASYYNLCFIGTNFITYCVGSNNYGQLGLGHTDSIETIEGVAAPDSKVVSVGVDHGCVVDGFGRVKCWGRNITGQVDPSLDKNLNYGPREVALGDGVVASKVTCGNGYTCVLLEDGTVRCWGTNLTGQLGNGSIEEQDSIVEVAFPTEDKMVDMNLGMSHICTLSEKGDWWCWGFNTNGQLGDGSNTHRPTPVRLADGGKRFIKVRSFGAHSCAVTDEGGASCWGRNLSGVLGTGLDEEELPESLTPVSVRIKGFTF